jgi:hypothetical protein
VFFQFNVKSTVTRVESTVCCGEVDSMNNAILSVFVWSFGRIYIVVQAIRTW